MQRLVYSPSVQCWVKSDFGTVDISPFITNCSIDRKVNQVSQATVTFRNPQMVFTNHTRPDGSVGPLFHPQDPIVFTMTRLKGLPIQVFTGYCDKTPYLQLFPGVCTIAASCTLKRLQYTFWDPGLPFVWNFLANYGWQVSQAQGGLVNSSAQASSQGGLPTVNKINDSSIGNLLFAVLSNVGAWDPSTIHIEEIPSSVIPKVTQLFTEFQKDNPDQASQFEDLLHQIIGTASLSGGGGGTSSSSAGGLTGAVWDVTASLEGDDHNTFCRSYPADQRGYSELGGTIGAGVGHGLGTLDCSVKLNISANGKTAIGVPKLDNGGGSTGPGFGGLVMGLYPGTIKDLGLDSGGQYHVTIQRTDGKPLKPAAGKLHIVAPKAPPPAPAPVSNTPAPVFTPGPGPFGPYSYPGSSGGGGGGGGSRHTTTVQPHAIGSAATGTPQVGNASGNTGSGSLYEGTGVNGPGGPLGEGGYIGPAG